MVEKIPISKRLLLRTEVRGVSPSNSVIFCPKIAILEPFGLHFARF